MITSLTVQLRPVKTPCFHCRGMDLPLDQETKSHILLSAAKIK